MLGCVVTLILIVLVFGTYLALREPQTQRGSAGALIDNRPKDTPSTSP